MSQYKSHPFVIALEALTPIFAPSFFLRSARDNENTPPKYPLIDYVIVGGDGKTRDRATNKWRRTYTIQLDFLIQETKPLSWCNFDELKDAQDRQALFNKFDEMTEDFLTMLIEPSKMYKGLNLQDFIYGKFEFRLEAFIASRYWAKHGKDKLTGISSRFSISALSDSEGICCLVDDTPEQWQNIQALLIQNTTSWRIVDKILNP